MAKMKKTEAEIIQQSVDLNMQELTACILGATPFICNAMSAKAKQGLLLPSGRKSSAEKATTLKHRPLEEFRESPYRSRDSSSPTVIQMVAVSFKRAIESMALDVPGATKAQISRNIVAPEQRIALYGVPQMLFSIVRSADMNKTPDVRSRAILPEWACRVRLRYPHPMFQEKIIAKYLALAGQLRGVGDFRPERGAGSYGLFEIVAPDDPRFLAVVASGGREAQSMALLAPEMHDDETHELYEWFETELDRRGVKTGRNGTEREEVRA